MPPRYLGIGQIPPMPFLYGNADTFQIEGIEAKLAQAFLAGCLPQGIAVYEFNGA